MGNSGKKTRGKQKIQMKIIEKEDEKFVTLSKRRSGIYKKISEITVLCGQNIVFICFSPEGGNSFLLSGTTVSQVAEQRRRLIFQDAREMGRVFLQGMYALENGHDDMPLYFDNMSFEGLLDVGEPIGSSGTSLRVATIRANLRRRRFLPITAQPTPNLLPKLKNVVSVYNEATRQMDAAKEKEKTHAGQESGRETNFWWEAPIDSLNMQELEELEFRYEKHVNDLYNVRNKKIEGTTNTNEDVAASLSPGAR
ncbi:hypothetical protein V6N11_037879 [Hibiscus sabdariffa]|uniref:MADS-box domain-containing protein n=1 Tax=Hibiscus sabdariffa TaxID=183260 RepID=A0ABR2A6F6_9ROSI